MTEGPASATPMSSLILRQIRDSLAATSASIERGPNSFARWARERLVIRTKTDQVIPFELNGVQKRVLAAKRFAISRGKKRRFLILKSRREGVTTLEHGISYRVAATRMNSEVVMLAHTKEETKRLFRIPKLMYMRDKKKPPGGYPGTTQIEFPTLRSLFFLGTAGAKSVGRGGTFTRFHWSEVAWSLQGPHQIDDQRELLSGLVEGASHGEAVLETTANGADLFCEKYREAKEGKNEWVPIFVPWFYNRWTNRIDLTDEQVEEMRANVTSEELDLMDRHGIDWGMLAFRRAKQAEHRQLFLQEYPEDDETCFLASGTSYFDVQIVTDLLKRAPDYERSHVPGGYEVTWEKPEAGVDYCAGCDTSEGKPGCDPNGVGIIRRDTGAQVYALHGLFSVEDLAERAAKACRRYNDALLGVEVENHGHAVLLRLRQIGYNSPNEQLFFRKRIPKRGWVDPGWSTNKITRPIMLADLARAVEDEAMPVRDREFLRECLTFRKQSGGQWAADSGQHDDRVVKWAIAWQMRNVRPAARRMRRMVSARTGQTMSS